MTDFWYDAPSKTLVYPGQAPPHVAPLLEGVKQNGKYWAVPHKLRNAIVLRHFNFPVAPIMDDYDFPNLHQLWDKYIRIYGLQELEIGIFASPHHDIKKVV